MSALKQLDNETLASGQYKCCTFPYPTTGKPLAFQCLSNPKGELCVEGGILKELKFDNWFCEEPTDTTYTCYKFDT